MAVEESTSSDLVELLRVEQQWRWQKGEGITVESYFASHPRLLADPTSALQMMYNEVLLREAAGECPRLEEYVRRFPQHKVQLALLFEVHHALESDELLSALADPMSLAKTLHETNNPWARGWPTIAGHEILAELGHGGMGVVYKARQVGLNRVVALKMILAGSRADASQLKRFRAEAEAVARLQHPNIVQIHHVGEADGCPYFSMEFVDGRSLAQELGGIPQPARQAAGFIRTLAQAMHTAHERGIIHRDLKPANVLLQKSDVPDSTTQRRVSESETPAISDPRFRTLDCVPKITDFGLAKQLDVSLGQTASGVIVGSPSYMAPEQASSRIGVIGPPADVYALGAILYELLTGRPPFKAETPMDTLRQLLADDPVPLSRFHLRVPPDLNTICMKCLQREPHKRYRSALALADDLDRFLHNRPIHARRTSSSERLWRWCRRNPVMALLIASVTSLALLLASGASVAALSLRRQLTRAQQAERIAQLEKESRTEQLCKASFAQAQVLRLSGRMGQRFESLNAIAEVARITRARGALEREPLDLRREAVACLALPDLRVGAQWRIPTWRPSSTFDATLEHYAYADDAGDIHVRQTADHEASARLPSPVQHPDQVGCQFSADGRFFLGSFALKESSFNLIWDLSARNSPREVLRLTDCWSVFAPDSRSLAAARSDLTLKLYNLVHGPAKTLCRDFRASQMAFRPDGKELACSDDRKPEVRIVDLESGELRLSLPDPDWNTALAWSSDNRLVAAASNNNRIYIWDGSTGRRQAVMEGSSGRVIALAFSPTGNVLASSGWDGITRLWDVWSGRPLVSGPGRLLKFSPDGRRLAFTDGDRMLKFRPDGQRPGLIDGDRLGIWEVEEGRECRLLQPRAEMSEAWRSYRGHESIDYSPDGRILASAGGDGIRLWDTASALEITHLDIGYHEAVLFHPSRSRLCTYGRAGLKIWPIERDPAKPTITVGPSQAIDVPFNRGWFQASCSLDGRTLAVTDDGNSQIIVMKLDQPSERVGLMSCSDVVSLALSRDGTWVAAGMVKGDVGVSIWDAQTGHRVHHLPTGDNGTVQSNVAFSPDGRWLLTGGQTDYRFWQVGSWRPGPVIERKNPGSYHGPLAFSRDGRMLAIAPSQHEVLLFDFINRRELTTLTAPDAHPLSRLCFNHDGAELAVSSSDHVVQLWDLRSIRRQLANLGLNWNLAP
jgi:eukaryotic-like serine/threonine-protein kinase